jgi:hypothetical protein
MIAAGLRAALKNISTARTRLCDAVWDARTSRHWPTLDNPDGDALYRRQAARPEEEKEGCQALSGRRGGRCASGAQKFTDRRWGENHHAQPGGTGR